MKCFVRITCILVVATCTGCDIPRDLDRVTETDKVIGTWQVDCVVRDGDCIRLPNGVVMEYEFTENRVTARTIEDGKPNDEMTWGAEFECVPRDDSTSNVSFICDDMTPKFRMNGLLKHEQGKIVIAFVETDSCRPQSVSDTCINGFAVTKLVLKRK